MDMRYRRNAITATRLSALSACALLAAVLGATPGRAQTGLAQAESLSQPAINAEQYESQMRMFWAMRPKLVIEISEANVNRYLTDHPDEFDMPAGLAAPRVAFGSGFVEVSARKRLLVMPSRVSVRLAPHIQDGRLALRATRVSAGWLPLPTALHGGVADTLTGVINGALELNNVTLSRIEVVRGMVRATATVQPMDKS